MVGLGVADFLLLVFGAVGVFVLIELKRLLFERYSYRGLDVIIAVAIAWTVVNYAGSFLMQLFFTFFAPVSAVRAEVVTTVFWIVCIGVFGIIVGLVKLSARRAPRPTTRPATESGTS